MGQDFQSYENKRFLAEEYAKSQRMIQRYSIKYFALTFVALLAAALFGIKFMAMTLVVSLTVYSFAILATKLSQKFAQWRADKKAEDHIAKTSDQNSQIEEPLLNSSSRASLRNFANAELSNVIHHKQVRINNLESEASFQEKVPADYIEKKHERALTQLYMLESTKTAALQGDEGFIKKMADEKLARRHRKSEMVKIIKEAINTGSISISLKVTGSKYTHYDWSLTGQGKENLLDAIETLNKGTDNNPFLSSPTGLPSHSQERETFLVQHLLPLLIDQDEVLKRITPVQDKYPIVSYRHTVFAQHYGIDSLYINNRLKGLETVKEEAWYSKARFGS
jgi:hypothetical protein